MTQGLQLSVYVEKYHNNKPVTVNGYFDISRIDPNVFRFSSNK